MGGIAPSGRGVEQILEFFAINEGFHKQGYLKLDGFGIGNSSSLLMDDLGIFRATPISGNLQMENNHKQHFLWTITD